MTDKPHVPAIVEPLKTTVEPNEGEVIESGQWYWIKGQPDPQDETPDDDNDDDDAEEREAPETEPDPAELVLGEDEYEDIQARRKQKEPEPDWLACVMYVGSNCVGLEGPSGRTIRIHLDAWPRYVRGPEHDAKTVIETEIKRRQGNVVKLIKKVEEISRRLGLVARQPLAGPEEAASSGSYAIAKISEAPDPKKYKAALTRAKDKQLPELFGRIKRENEHLARWMTGPTLPLRAQASGMEDVIDVIKGRIFNVTLYAGLTEQVVVVREGEPAPYPEKLRLMQRRCYMDEECLLNYRHGGMEFRNIKQFDAWLSKPENADRILPFPRCMVAMRVRREKKEREFDGTLHTALINIRLGELDELTFFFIRNGERIYRLNTDLELGELIFPGRNEFNLSEPMMVQHGWHHEPKDFITVHDYEVESAKAEEKRLAGEAWAKENTFKKWKAGLSEKQLHDSFGRPRCEDSLRYTYEREVERRTVYPFKPDDWVPFDRTNLYYDECVEHVRKRVEHYNRIALIIQGLFDRSEVFHPHPPVKTWTPEGFAEAIELVYDGDHTLADGEAPSWEAYVAQCNAEINADSVFIGQEQVWMEKEAERENARRDRNWNYKAHDRVKTYSPYGNDGPGYLARAVSVSMRGKTATFRWTRQRQTRDRWAGKRYGDPVPAVVTVPFSALFNVSAYKPGDYLTFFRDPRTRAAYLKWAEILLTAEEYYAGNMKAQEPLVGSPRRDE